MNKAEAKRAVQLMYAANGVNKGEDVIEQVAYRVMRADCDTCARHVIEQATENGPAIFVPQFRKAMQNEMDSPRHIGHVAQDDAVTKVAEAERFWHHDVVKHLGGGLWGEWIAARMWASEGVARDLDDVDLALSVFEETGPYPDEAMVRAAWTYAREIARKPPSRMTDAEWKAVVDPFTVEWVRLGGKAVGKHEDIIGV